MSLQKEKTCTATAHYLGNRIQMFCLHTAQPVSLNEGTPWSSAMTYLQIVLQRVKPVFNQACSFCHFINGCRLAPR